MRFAKQLDEALALSHLAVAEFQRISDVCEAHRESRHGCQHHRAAPAARIQPLTGLDDIAYASQQDGEADALEDGVMSPLLHLLAHDVLEQLARHAVVVYIDDPYRLVVVSVGDEQHPEILR